MQPRPLDALDLALLDRVQRDARQTSEQLGEAVGLSASAVQRRLHRLRDDGVITAEVAILDADAIGRPMTMVVEVTLERERPHLLDEFKALMRATPEVAQCYYVTGNADFILVVTAKDMADYEAFIHRFFLENANIKRFRTNVVLNRVKAGFALPLDTRETALCPSNEPTDARAA